jgi:hypothetical protein
MSKKTSKIKKMRVSRELALVEGCAEQNICVEKSCRRQKLAERKNNSTSRLYKQPLKTYVP